MSLDNILHEMHDMATNHQCVAEITIRDPETQTVWEQYSNMKPVNETAYRFLPG